MTLTTRQADFSARYNELVVDAQLAQNSAVRWCMVIKPYGFAIRENIQKNLDAMIKKTWHTNAYFPLLIPKSFFAKEAKHVEWFATESAIVTHYRLKNDGNGNIVVDPDAKLEEELIIRPTSETIIRNTYKDRIQSYRDLPILINQRANVVRREMRTRLFLRTAEFLRQEGHTAHATADEAREETIKMRKVYNDIFTNFLAMDGVMWEKSANERFAGADNTYTIECMMQDGKALQACTSHYLGQSFGKAFDVTFTNRENKPEFAYATSRWLSTRSMWWLIMSHSDDKWLVLPPALAPFHVVIVPIWKTPEDKDAINIYIEKILSDLSDRPLIIKSETLGNVKIDLNIKVDRDDAKSPGRKYNQYELQWVPVRVAIWARDLSSGAVEVYRRDEQTKESVTLDNLSIYISDLLPQIQSNLLTKNRQFRQENTIIVDTWEQFEAALDNGKFVYAHRDGSGETEDKIKEMTKATIRCIPDAEQFPQLIESGKCILTGTDSDRRVLFARSY